MINILFLVKFCFFYKIRSLIILSAVVQSGKISAGSTKTPPPNILKPHPESDAASTPGLKTDEEYLFNHEGCNGSHESLRERKYLFFF